MESVYAVGGYKTPLRALGREEVFEVVVVSGAGPQFEAEYLDYADFFWREDGKGGVLGSRLGEYEGLGKWPERWVDVLKVCEDEKGEFFVVHGKPGGGASDLQGRRGWRGMLMFFIGGVMRGV